MKPLSLFSAYGIELEYMIVDQTTLAVKPISDQLIYDVVGKFQNELQFGQIAWSNELVLHVIELKTNGPAAKLAPLANQFQAQIKDINRLLTKYQAKLLPSGAHPFMDPFTETKRWSHDDTIIYDTYHQIFDCRGHGWANLQSVHLNLPFANDEEFAKLHTAIRLLLPIIPALCASTPIIDGKITGFCDTRLEFYRLNQQKIPSITGDVIPELIFTQQQYESQLLNKMYQDIASYDDKQVLQEEWLNSRGAIARFDRNTIEIRIIDSQECPLAELALISLIVATLKALIAEKWLNFSQQTQWQQETLKDLFLHCVKAGSTAQLPVEYLHLFGAEAKQVKTANDLWQHLLQHAIAENAIPFENIHVLTTILQQGNLAERILKALKSDVSLSNIKKIYQQLADCLATGELFLSQ